MKLNDAIKIIEPGTETREMCRIAEENQMSIPEAIAAARQMAARLMRYAVENKVETHKEEDGKMHVYCPNCTADITGHGEWEFCSFCGQAVTFPEEE